MIMNFYESKPVSGGPPKQIVIFLHGVGSNGKDLVWMAQYFAQALPDATFISPDAPFHYDLAPPDFEGYQWFSLQERSFEKRLEGVQMIAPMVHDFMDATLKRFNLPAQKIALVGFSQGTMTSLYAGPRYKDKIAGVLGYSGALIWEEKLPKGVNVIPVHLIHGDKDEVVPFPAYDHGRKRLQKEGFPVSGSVSEGLGHSIDQEGILSGIQFLQEIFS